MNLCGYYPESINEGEGLRASIFISGCRHRCKGCFSPVTWNFNYGEPFTLQRQNEIIGDIARNPLLSGISLLGGDPFFSAAEVSEFLDRLYAQAGAVNTWIYTGYTYEELTADPLAAEYALLRRCHVLVDGRFEEALRDTSLRYCGSSNQRLINIPASLASGKVELWEPTVRF
ncbi:anaerobic ribonucleoside-triphosphate reductase activating protein [Paenibacillus physcomitrellae]|uniref:Anaerobic ribonucleoside-triphosphate reductase-activating protein n=1 Tax=Paenibacillus physcomitrellae TaxID=1619311 RepID=A0ABQ1FWK1_9BACL|nr:anaerobic ribonucleoside-triphosphate reductase activating protein [Paenibacillus physcomitrellae]GGA31361.1 anaerobic ribonucleoside-triphosphate reductase-activating protein [Paenibacillus physcomitrellae]